MDKVPGVLVEEGYQVIKLKNQVKKQASNPRNFQVEFGTGVEFPLYLPGSLESIYWKCDLIQWNSSTASIYQYIRVLYL